MDNEINVDELLKRLLEEEEFVRSQTLNYDEYLPEFISKAEEDLEIIESCAIELERDIENSDIINKMFRSFHNIKGSSGFVGQNAIQRVAHQTETLLDGCRQGAKQVTEQIIDLILKSADLIKKILEDNDLNNDEMFLDQAFLHIQDLQEEENSGVEAKDGSKNTVIKTEDYNQFFDEFAAEVGKNLEEVEEKVISLEKGPGDKTVINHIFRSFHTIKGLAGFSGQTLIQRIAHEIESFLDGYRQDDIQINTQAIGLITDTSRLIIKICSDINLLQSPEFIEQVYIHIQKLENEKMVIEDYEPEEAEIDEECFQDFIQEAFEHIENIEMNLLNLEKEPEDQEIINSLFRSFHTIKGLAGFVGQLLIGKIAHQTESLLDECRKKTFVVDKSIVDIILTSSDYIKKICENNVVLKNRDFLSEVNFHLQNISVAEKNKSGEAGAPSPKIGEILVEEKKMTKDEVDKILEKQKDQPDIKFGEIAVKEGKIQSKDIISAVRTQNAKTSQAEDYMRISTGKVDSLVDMVGELAITQSLIEQFAILQLGSDSVFATNFNRMTRIIRELQDLAMFLRMVPLKSTFNKISRIARDTINELGKDINFSTLGDETEIDRVVTEKLLDPLVHLVKNAIFHGVEPAEQRTSSGKPAQGNIRVNAYNKRGSIYIEIIDDGGGINTERVYQKALEKGIIDPNKDYGEKEIQEFIMLPGFSTVDVANNISGRGVGMDVVKTEIQKIGGKVDLASEKGQGTTFILKIPVNHAIMNGTVVDIEGSKYILPTLNVKQIIQPEESQWVYVQGKKSMVRVREDVIPLISIKDLFERNTEEEPSLIVIVELDQRYKAIPVRNVIGRQEIVVKPVCEEFTGLRFISGMSILSDGHVSLILDVENLFSAEGLKL